MYSLKKNIINLVLICDSLLKCNETEQFLKTLSTGDEKWIIYDKNVQKRSWSNGKQAPQIIAKPVLPRNRYTSSVWRERRGSPSRVGGVAALTAGRPAALGGHVKLIERDETCHLEVPLQVGEATLELVVTGSVGVGVGRRRAARAARRARGAARPRDTPTRSASPARRSSAPCAGPPAADITASA
ncbi:Histone-lysine N-methyltransferase SETMAR [Eumeta japonica]|uniref:Histone-lysine N-methyltransferase SETMAR n=1 Tax=Eumeta variegata TaxID=151549 RepID=A0A4C1XCR5_EUMVA|nr:Histone-lysine N-methyltransferase SETMAR [Eumeta japonica]